MNTFKACFEDFIKPLKVTQWEGLKGEESVAEICRLEGIAPALYYRWSKDFIEAGKRRLNGDTVSLNSSDPSI